MKFKLMPDVSFTITVVKAGSEKWLTASIVFSIALMVMRIILSGSFIFTFLLWNLFLAFIPFAISQWLIRKGRKDWGKFLLLFVMWLLFIPNSFYIITDLFHLGTFNNIPLWFDLTMILSFAWNGMLLGILSVDQMQKILNNYITRSTGVFFIYPIMFLNALGVYIGRYLRFNSWDIITDPFHLAKEIVNLVIHPIEYKSAWGMVVCFSVFFTLIFFTLIGANKGTRIYANRRE